MATFRAKYGGKCARCPRAIVPGQLIEAERGVRPRHVDCTPAGPDFLRRERKLVTRAHYMAAWTQRNPPPDLDRQVVARGGPHPPDLSEFYDDEERRCARDRYDDKRSAWLEHHPDLVAAHAAALGAWQKKRASAEAAFNRGVVR